MKERPILFNSEMVRAILEGRKTQTRRLVKPQPSNGFHFHGAILESTDKARKRNDAMFGNKKNHLDSTLFEYARPPFGVIGDELWVRETFCIADHVPGYTISNEGGSEWTPEFTTVGYRADKGHKNLCDVLIDGTPDGKPDEHEQAARYNKKLGWVPSIHMPRWASRIQLRITDIRVERLQDITKEDAFAEGATSKPRDTTNMPRWAPKKLWKMDWSELGKLSRYAQGIHPRCKEKPLTVNDIGLIDARMAFASYWNSIYSGGEYGWQSNPWVWVVEFERVK